MAKDGHDHRPGLKGRTEANQPGDPSQGPSTSADLQGPGLPSGTRRKFAWDKRVQRPKDSTWNDAARQEITVLNHLLDRARL